MRNSECLTFLQTLPKAELHVHIEGTMEPAQLMSLAQQNSIALPTNLFNAAGAYAFSGLDSFVKTYFQATHVLCNEQDFYDLTYAYLKKISTQGVLHTEIFFDLQSYMPRPLSPGVIIGGMHRALEDGQRDFGITSFLIMCFIRHLSEQDAFKALDLLRDYKDKVIGVGLASVEQGNPPSKFERVFTRARIEGYRVVAHVAESNGDGSTLIRQALKLLHVERIDHGIGCMQDQALIRELAQKEVPLTVCPLSNIALGFFNHMHDHPLKAMLDAGLMVSINSDDPAFFGGYISQNYIAAAEHLGLSCSDLVTCARNSFVSSFLPESTKQIYLAALDEYASSHAC